MRRLRAASRALLIGCCLVVAACQSGTTATGDTPSAVAVPKTITTVDEWRATTARARAEDRLLTASEAAYFLRKTGYDPAPSEVLPWIGQTRYRLIAHVLETASTQPVVPIPDWTRATPRYWGHQDWTEARRTAFENARRQEVGDLRQWWLAQMLATPSPLAERMVMFWQNTFVAGFSGLKRRSHAQWIHHATIRDHALGSYEALLRAMLRDPAILTYLDNVNNSKDSPNENLARELFELFTLGEGNYSERDIKEAARALAGWHVSRYGTLSFQEKAWARDFGRKTIFGQTGRFDGDDLIDLILQQEAAYTFLARRLWQEFVSSDPAPEPVIVAWADGFRRTGLDTKAMLEIVFTSDAFWNPAYRGTSVKSPAELAVGALRFAQSDALSLAEIDSAVQAMGQRLFDPPDVSGWGYGEYWLEPGFLIERDTLQAKIAERIDAPVQTAMTTQTAEPDTGRVLRVRLAAEAYRGDPIYVVTIQHEAGLWRSPAARFEGGRDTERLGRYRNESEIVWRVVEVPIPDSVGDIERVSIGFRNDAAGNDGDRNLFVGGVDLDGLAISANAGVQTPGCRGDGGRNARREPGRLYCAGELAFDWKEIQQQAATNPDLLANKIDLVTNEMVLRHASAPDRPRRRFEIVFDELRYQGRQWDYLAAVFLVDQKGRYQVRYREDSCAPSCLTRWPTDAYRDETGMRSTSAYLASYDDWTMRQTNALSSEDRDLTKALLSVLPEVIRRSETSNIHKSPEARDRWAEVLADFVDKADSRQWRPDHTVTLVEQGPWLSEQTGSMGMSMSAMSMDQRPYRVATGIMESQEAWEKALAASGPLAETDLADWSLSVSDGQPVLEPAGVVLSPFTNLK